MNILIENTDLFVNSNKVSFNHAIDKVVEFEDLLVVLLMDNEVPDHNVYALDISGNVIWNVSQVVKLPYAEAYISISRASANILKVVSYNGVEFHIDVNDGIVVNKVVVK